MADGEVFTGGTGRGRGWWCRSASSGDLVLPAGAFYPGRASEIRELTARALVYATQARG
jgi:hypothetical protein